MKTTDQMRRLEIANPSWRGMCRIGGAAALIAVVLFRRNFGAELIGFRGFGIIDVPASLPTSAIEWFGLIQDNRLLGLALFNLVDLLNYALVGLLFLSLYGLLKETSKGAMMIAMTIGLVGIAVYFASNQAFSMLSLSDTYAAATANDTRSALLAAGEALLAINNPAGVNQGTGIYTSLLLVTLAGLIISIVMLQSDIFGKTTGLVGALANVLGLGYFIALIFAPSMYALPTIVSAPFRVAWYLLIARQLFRLGRHGK